MKILFVAMPESIHTSRWIEQINDQGWDIHLLPSNYRCSMERQIKNVTIHRGILSKKSLTSTTSRPLGWALKVKRVSNFLNFIRNKIDPDYQARALNRLIKKIKPDIVHSLEFQTSGYLVLRATKMFAGQFPAWIATNWGSDIYWFKKFPNHNNIIREILQNADYYSAECNRDICLAKEMGFKGKSLPVFPNAGGYDLKKIEKWRRPLKERKIVLLKGKLDIWGKIEVGLNALAYCVQDLKNYKIVVYSASGGKKVQELTRKFQEDTGLKIRIIDKYISHEEILKLHGQARLSIGISLSDAISTSFLEALVMGSFPIQTDTSCANEWITNGVSGMIVPADDVRIIANVIKTALQDDKLVATAGQKNWQTATRKLDYNFVKAKTRKFYNFVESDSKKTKNKTSKKLGLAGINKIAELLIIIWIIFFMFIWFFINFHDQIEKLKQNSKISQVLKSKFYEYDQQIESNNFLKNYILRTFR